MDTPSDLPKRIRRQASTPRQRNKSPQGKARENRQTLKLVIRSMAPLQSVVAPNEVVETMIKEIINRDLTDDSGIEVARTLLDAQATLQLAGVDDTDEAGSLTDRIVREGLRGARARAAVREVVGPVVKQVETDQQASGVLLTPEERANASRLLGVQAGDSVTNPAPLQDGGTAITERDLKELVLRGNGGAGTPEVTVFPVLQPPHGPLVAPLPGVPGVGGDPITGQESTGNLRARPVLQRLKRLREQAAAPANTSAMPLGAASAEPGPMAPQLFDTQAGGLAGAEIRFGGLTAFQTAPLLA